ncbi:hypothetical protein BCV70DRAFT_213914 [Testicularia cyperi]|uniref:NADH2 dehydrogenase n=1 Tax=Testicularia cyperi TaxID=1882483 RepID=A0A317XI54_9BASI|nr:hypothetical protein BCV70DRAFT_213914 [Testicularia cyperi]
MAMSAARRAATPSGAFAPAAVTFAARLKKSTNITGLEVSPYPLEELKEKFSKTLSLLQTLPDSSVYKQATSALTQHKLSTVEKAIQQTKGVENNAEKLESVYQQTELDLDAGQLEQVLQQASAEYHLVAKMIDWKAWEPLQNPPAPGQWSYFSMAEEAGEGGEDQHVDGSKN